MIPRKKVQMVKWPMTIWMFHKPLGGNLALVLWSMVEGVSRFVSASGRLVLTKGKCIQWGIIALENAMTWRDVGWCKKTMTNSTQVDPLKNGGIRRFMFRHSPVRALTLTLLKCCRMTRERLREPGMPEILMNWNTFRGRNGPRFLHWVVHILFAAAGNVRWRWCC